MRRLFIAVTTAVMVITLGIGRDPLMAASGVELTMRNGHVWLVSDGATVADILDAWVTVGHVRIVGAEPLSSRTATLHLSDVAESEALSILLRATGYGFLAVLRPMATTDASTFDRIFIVQARPGTAGPGITATAPTPTPPAIPDQGPFVQGPVVPGVRRVVGADGQPVPDDQSGGGSPPRSSPPPATAAPTAPTPPGASPRPGMIIPPPAPPGPASPPD